MIDETKIRSAAIAASMLTTAFAIPAAAGSFGSGPADNSFPVNIDTPPLTEQPALYTSNRSSGDSSKISIRNPLRITSEDGCTTAKLSPRSDKIYIGFKATFSINSAGTCSEDDSERGQQSILSFGR